MKSSAARNYNMDTRSKSSAQTEANILKALGTIWLQQPMHSITLEKIAEEAGTTVRTILRKFGSRDGLIEATIDHDVAGIKSIKDEARAGDIKHAASILMKEYEATGLAGIRSLAIEHELPAMAKVLKYARQLHKAWCERVFQPYLPKTKGKNYDIMVGVFYAATDINTWKLLRIDLEYSKEETEKIFYKTLQAITKT